VKITAVRATWLQARIPPERAHVSDFGRNDSFNTCLVEIDTDAGLTGLGEAKVGALAARLAAAGLDPNAISVSGLLDPLTSAAVAGGSAALVRDALAGAIRPVFAISLVAAVLALIAATLAPGGHVRQFAARRDAASASITPHPAP